MSPYSVVIPRCTHIRTNGTQCGSPALRGRRFCFFHKNWRGQRIQLGAKLPASPATFTLPVLEDANSVQIALMQVIQLLLSGRIDAKTAGLLLYALQTASLNLKHTDLEPRTHERVVIDPGSVRDTPLGEHPWQEEDFMEDEDDENEGSNEDETCDEENGEGEDDEDAQIRGGQDLAAFLLKSLGLPPPGSEDDAENDNEDHDQTAGPRSDPTG
jgi:hypothetical protein